MKYLIVAMSCTLTISGCQPNINKDDYFPLQEGVKYSYKVTELHTNNTEPYYFLIENLGKAKITLDDKYFGMDVSVRRDQNGTKYFILEAEDGVFRIAQQTIVQSEPIYDNPERKILPSSDKVKSGSVWYVQSRTYALRDQAIDNVPDADDISFDLEYEIESINETVRVPAGTYENVIKIVGRSTFTLYADPKVGYMDVDIVHSEWYAPGVGLIMLVREEPKEIGLFSGGSITYELSKVEF